MNRYRDSTQIGPIITMKDDHAFDEVYAAWGPNIPHGKEDRFTFIGYERLGWK